MVAAPEAAGVKTPALLTAPMLGGLTDQVTDVPKLPVPVTAALQADVCVLRMEFGVQVTDTEVIVEATVTLTAADPDLVVSSDEVAVTVAVPAAVGVNTPALLIVPMLAGVTDHVTVEL
jgi:hypothetical protein